MLDLALRCDVCHVRAAAVRLADRSICAPCAHEAIDRVAPMDRAAQVASDAARVLVWARAGLDVTRPRGGMTLDRHERAIARLVREGRITDRTESDPTADPVLCQFLGWQPRRRIVELVGAPAPAHAA